MKRSYTAAHDHQRSNQRAFICFHQSFTVSCSVIVPHYRHGALIQAKHRHEDKGLQLEINTEHRHRCRIHRQNRVITQQHKGSNRLHHHARQSDRINISHYSPVYFEATETNLHCVLPVTDDPYRHSHGHTLTDYCGQCGTRHLKPGHPEKSENQNRVQHNICHCTAETDDHRCDHISRGLQHLLQLNLHHAEKTQRRDDAEICHSVRKNLRIIRIRTHKRLSNQKADYRKRNEIEHADPDTGACRLVGFLEPFGPQPSGNQRIDSHRTAHCD